MPGTQRRHFSRVPFHGDATLAIGGTRHVCEVRDLSLKGALVLAAEPVETRAGDACALELRLDDADAVVRMEGEVAHGEGPRVGLVCRSIDLDSITHLRRLLELNLGDASLLEREFTALLSG